MAEAETGFVKQEATPAQGERTRPTRVYIPRVDIIENEKAILLVADLPGVDEQGVDITVEKNSLTIRGTLSTDIPEGCSPGYCEYGIGDFERTFTISSEIDREGIEARMKDGVLRLTLPKAKQALTKKISVVPG